MPRPVNKAAGLGLLLLAIAVTPPGASAAAEAHASSPVAAATAPSAVAPPTTTAPPPAAAVTSDSAPDAPKVAEKEAPDEPEAQALVFPGGIRLGGLFDAAYERENRSDGLTSGRNAFRSYHRFLFLTRQGKDIPVGFNAELLGLYFSDCHAVGGDAKTSRLVLTGNGRVDRAMVVALVTPGDPAGSELLIRAGGGDAHPGDVRLPPDSPEYATVSDWIAMLPTAP